jgi:hypothetical protein
VTAPEGFRRAWLSWFVCPHCGYRSLFPQLAGKLGADRKSIAILYWCASCAGLSKRKRQWLAPVLALALAVPTFVLIYRGLLDGLSLSTVLWVACVVTGMHLFSLVIERIANQYVAAEHDEP